jgi:Gpi18-like mannosyltransferase
MNADKKRGHLRVSALIGGGLLRSQARRLSLDLLLVALLLPATLLVLLLAYQLPRAARFDFDQHWRSFAFAGFSGRERFPASEVPFRWSRAEAALGLPNPGQGPLRWRLVLAAGPRGQVPLRLNIGGAELPSITISAEPRVYHLLAPQRAPGQQFTLALSAPPARDSAADRTLGVALGPLSFATVAPQRPPPPLALALALAVVGLYALIRQAGLRPASAAALALAALGALALAQALLLWRWGLSLQLLLALGLASLVAVLVERILPPAHPAAAESGLPRPSSPAHSLIRSGFSGLLPLAALSLLVLVTRLPLLALADPSGDINVMGDRATLLAEQGLTQAYYRGNDYLALRHLVLLGVGSVAETLGLSLRQPRSYAASALLKAPQLLADLLVVLLIFLAARRWRAPQAALALAALYALTPPVWMNAAWWGQVDAILILGMLAALLLLERGAAAAWLAWALALQVKAQPILLAPIMAAATLRLHRARGILLGGGAALATLAIGALPLILAGQTAALLGAYEGAVGRYPFTSVSAYNLWSLVHGVRLVRDGQPLLLGLSPLQIGLLLLALVCLRVVVRVLRQADLATRFEASAALALAFFALTTQMHQRYIIFVYPFLLLAAAASPRLRWPYLLLALSGTLNIFGTLAFLPPLDTRIAASPLPALCALVNLGVLGYLLWRRS